jgi:hypothetical protein
LPGRGMRPTFGFPGNCGIKVTRGALLQSVVRRLLAIMHRKQARPVNHARPARRKQQRSPGKSNKPWNSNKQGKRPRPHPDCSPSRLRSEPFN